MTSGTDLLKEAGRRKDGCLPSRLPQPQPLATTPVTSVVIVASFPGRPVGGLARLTAPGGWLLGPEMQLRRWVDQQLVSLPAGDSSGAWGCPRWLCRPARKPAGRFSTRGSHRQRRRARLWAVCCTWVNASGGHPLARRPSGPVHTCVQLGQQPPSCCAERGSVRVPAGRAGSENPCRPLPRWHL